MRNGRGFTLIELMIVIVIIGLLAAIAIPNFMNMTTRARVADVKTNMHTMQLTIEDFATRNDSAYPANALDTTSDGGLTLVSLLPSGTPPNNPFTLAPTTLNWGAAAGTPYGGADVAGGIQINTWSGAGGNTDTYEIIGEDENGTLISLILTNQ